MYILLTEEYINKRDTLFLYIVSKHPNLPQLPPDIRRYIYRQIREDPKPDPVYFSRNHPFDPISDIEVQRKLIQDMIDKRVMTVSEIILKNLKSE